VSGVATPNIGLEAIRHKELDARANGCKRKTITHLIAGVPCDTAIDKGIELVAAQILITSFLIEAYFS